MTASARSVHALAGKVAVVTGGSRGLGLEMVRAFAEQGADVVVASRKGRECDRVARELEVRGGRALGVAFDAASWDDCDRLVEAAYGAFGRVDVLVNNAGMSPLYPSLADVSAELFWKVVGVNLAGPFRLAAAVGSRMAAEGGGSIINVGSVEAIRPHPGALPYAAAKAGLHTLTEGFAQAYGPTVRVNTLQPGAFLTDVSEHWSDETRQRIEGTVALGRCADPGEVVGTALFLASDASSYVSGAVVRVDGGWR